MTEEHRERAFHQSGAPPRVLKRPDPADWREDEFLSLREAAALFWPDGPIKAASAKTRPGAATERPSL